VAFTKLVEPTNANSGWTVATAPTTSPVTSHHFDVVIGADGKQNCLPGFHSKEFRAKLALAITANYVNSFTKQESSVPEISGVSYVYRQSFFDDLSNSLGIELENIVYYKDETHYFVMTAKKNSLLKKGVLKRVCTISLVPSLGRGRGGNGRGGEGRWEERGEEGGVVRVVKG
jgi:hypothetical protein